LGFSLLHLHVGTWDPNLTNHAVDLLALSVGHRLCIDFLLVFFFGLRANFLTTLRSHLVNTYSCYFSSSFFNVGVTYSYIFLVDYNFSLKCIEKITIVILANFKYISKNISVIK
jgi:hypothetical protein